MIELIAGLIVASPFIIIVGVVTLLVLRWRKRHSISPGKGGMMDI